MLIPDCPLSDNVLSLALVYLCWRMVHLLICPSVLQEYEMKTKQNKTKQGPIPSSHRINPVLELQIQPKVESPKGKRHKETTEGQ